MIQDLNGKVALVTGAARRIGKAICLRLASEGVRIVLSYRHSEAEALGVVRELRARGVDAAALRADLADPADLERLAGDSMAAFGGVDILVNNASAFFKTTIDALCADRDAFRRHLALYTSVHVEAPLWLGMRLGCEMKRRGWGRIVNITDRVTHAGQAYRHWSLYLVSKYGLEGVTQVLAEELRPEVTVNSVAPGLVVPPEHLAPEEVERLLERVPLGRAAGPEEIAEDVLHLIRSESKTGAVILTDGGASTHTR